MFVIFIIIAAAAIGYFIYQGLSSTKFEKANILLSNRRLDEAIVIYNEIFNDIPQAPGRLAECYYLKGISERSATSSKELLQKVLHIKNRLIPASDKSLYEDFEAKAGCQLAVLNFEEIKSNKRISLEDYIKKLDKNLIQIKTLCKTNYHKEFRELEDKHFKEIAASNLQIVKAKFSTAKSARATQPTAAVIKLIEENLNSIEPLCKLGQEKKFNLLKEDHYLELADIFLTLGIIDEQRLCFKETRAHYKTAYEYASKAKAGVLLYNIITRVLICRLKINEVFEVKESFIGNVSKAQESYKNEFFYRLAVRYLYDQDYIKAEDVVRKFLPAKNKSVEFLARILRNEKIVQLQGKFEELNRELESLFVEDFPIDVMEELYGKLDHLLEEVEDIPEITTKVKELKASIFNRLLHSYIHDKRYNVALELIKAYPEFWKVPELLKNLGICALGIIKTGELDKNNYKLMISSWLSAVFSEKVILSSLEATTWDDEYTFSLVDSVGSEYTLHNDLPENVNYDEVTDQNISIGATQKELIQQFEHLLVQVIGNTNFLKEVQAFYDLEKQAIQNIVAVIPEDILFAGPHFAKLFRINESIINALDEDYAQYKNEESLEAGVPYLILSVDSEVGKYSQAKKTIEVILKAIGKQDLADLRTVLKTDKISVIKRYESLSEKLEDDILNSVLKLAEKDRDNESLISLMEYIIPLLPKTSKIRYQHASYVVGLCISKVNSKKIGHKKALELLKEAYLISPDNLKVCQNLVTLIKFNLMDILNDKTNLASQIYTILDTIYNKRSKVFIQCAVEIAKERDEFMSQLKKAGADLSLFSDDDNLRALISGKYLSPQGEKMKKILSYMRKLSEGSIVQSGAGERKAPAYSNHLPF
jgi:hypothetical protein